MAVNQQSDWTFATGINQQKSDLTTTHTGLAKENGNVITGNWNLYSMIYIRYLSNKMIGLSNKHGGVITKHVDLVDIN